jgi:NAD(P)-dependent dehydrogenase (short-subunit alcohol dehydrogenase family)
VNNAGILDRQMLLEGTAQEWDRVHAVNSKGVFLLMREAARAMVEAKAGGRMVNIASAALIGSLTYGHAAYAASKAALVGLMRAAAFELAVHKITVNTIMAGGAAARHVYPPRYRNGRSIFFITPFRRDHKPKHRRRRRLVRDLSDHG